MPSGRSSCHFTSTVSCCTKLAALCSQSARFFFLNGRSPIESREARRRRTWLGEFKRNLRDGILVAFRLLALRLHLGLCFHRLNRRSNLLLNFLGLRLWSVNTGVRASIKAAQAVVWAIWE